MAFDPSKLTDEQIGAILNGTGGAPPEELSWGDVPGKMVENAIPSAQQFIADMIQPIMHPVQTAQTFADIGKGLVAKAGLMDSPQGEATVDALVKFFGDRYGSVEALKQTMATDPVGAFSDIATVLTGGGGALARGPGMVGKTGRVVQKLGSAIDPITNMQRGAKAVVRSATPVLGMTTSAGQRPFQEAIKAGKAAPGSPQREAFLRHMRGRGNMDEPLELADKAVGKLAKQRSDEYRTGMGTIKSDRTELSMRAIDKAILEAEDMVYPYGVKKSKKAEKILKRIKEASDSRLHLRQTPGAVDDFKQALREIRADTMQGTAERKIVEHVYNKTVKTIARQAPTYQRVMKRYSDASEQIDEIRSALSVNDRASADTTLRKLQSPMRNNVNTNYGRREQVLDEMGKLEPELIPGLAGMSLNKVAPRGLSGLLGGALVTGSGPMSLLDPAVAASMLLSAGTISPRFMGEVAYLSGKLPSKKFTKATKGLHNAGRADRVAPDAFDPSKLTDEQIDFILNGVRR